MARIFVESDDSRVRVELTQKGDSYEWVAHCNLCPEDPVFRQPDNLLADTHEQYSAADALDFAERHADTEHPAWSPPPSFDERPF